MKCREWVTETNAAANKRLSALESELNNAKTNLIKESIRLGHNDLGNFHYMHGNPQVTPCHRVRAII
jgi:COP9 signalosome complex subunit 1